MEQEALALLHREIHDSWRCSSRGVPSVTTPRGSGFPHTLRLPSPLAEKLPEYARRSRRRGGQYSGGEILCRRAAPAEGLSDARVTIQMWMSPGEMNTDPQTQAVKPLFESGIPNFGAAGALPWMRDESVPHRRTGLRRSLLALVLKAQKVPSGFLEE